SARDAIHVPRGGVLFREGEAVDALYLLVSGAVVLYRDQTAGRRLAVHLVVPGRSVGFRAMAEGRNHRATARCARDSVLCRIPSVLAEQTFAAHRPLERVFLRDLTQELGLMRERLMQVISLGVRDRLVLLLDRMVQAFGMPKGDGWLIDNPLKRLDMASLAGMAPETISRCIRHLQEEDLAHFNRKNILLPSREAFSLEVDAITQRE
ncbi:MAG: Crp/Fnr family transcriptional regulator, partial [Magnetospirillum sp.]